MHVRAGVEPQVSWSLGQSLPVDNTVCSSPTYETRWIYFFFQSFPPQAIKHKPLTGCNFRKNSNAEEQFFLCLGSRWFLLMSWSLSKCYVSLPGTGIIRRQWTLFEGPVGFPSSWYWRWPPERPGRRRYVFRRVANGKNMLIVTGSRRENACERAKYCVEALFLL